MLLVVLHVVPWLRWAHGVRQADARGAESAATPITTRRALWPCVLSYLKACGASRKTGGHHARTFAQDLGPHGVLAMSHRRASNGVGHRRRSCGPQLRQQWVQRWAGPQTVTPGTTRMRQAARLTLDPPAQMANLSAALVDLCWTRPCGLHVACSCRRALHVNPHRIGKRAGNLNSTPRPLNLAENMSSSCHVCWWKHLRQGARTHRSPMRPTSHREASLPPAPRQNPCQSRRQGSRMLAQILWHGALPRQRRSRQSLQTSGRQRVTSVGCSVWPRVSVALPPGCSGAPGLFFLAPPCGSSWQNLDKGGPLCPKGPPRMIPAVHTSPLAKGPSTTPQPAGICTVQARLFIEHPQASHAWRLQVQDPGRLLDRQGMSSHVLRQRGHADDPVVGISGLPAGKPGNAHAS